MDQSGKAVRVHLWISGRVQGVCFRVSTRDSARQLGLVGWVRNLSDGRVEVLVEGPEAAVERFVASCHRGPPMACVRDVERVDSAACGSFDRFEIR